MNENVVSLTAGVTEEIIYRGSLMFVLVFLFHFKLGHHPGLITPFG
ncbi:hypothetical protein STFR1_30211 [Bacillus vallismortis]